MISVKSFFFIESDTKKRAREAVEEALRNRLLEIGYTKAAGAFIYVSGSPDMKLSEVSAVGDYVRQTLRHENSDLASLTLIPAQ